MSKTQWKDIPVVPTSQEFLDIVLSRTYDSHFWPHFARG